MTVRAGDAALAEWLDRHTGDAPAALRARVRARALAAAGAAEPGAPADAATTLARAGLETLDAVTRRAGDRSVALDLLAADALVTLALLARAETAPAELGAFAAALLDAHAAPGAQGAPA
ncbi:MAG TPA: hypothetical protein VFS40_03030 [Gemmatimonadales bacterium]|nr:hypothetical protein [Gemmatimonadales bacterium]